MTELYDLNNKNLTLVKLDQHFTQPFKENVNHNLEGIHIFLSLKGKGSYQSLISEHISAADTNTINIDLINFENQGIFDIPKDTHKQSLSLFVKKEYFLQNISLNSHTEKIYEFFEKTNPIKNVKNKKINKRSNLLAHQIFNNPYTGDLSKLSLESKCLELIYLELSDILTTNETKIDKQIILSAKDKEAIYHAKDILTTNLHNPPSIKQLSQMVAINELKLKFGFNKFFHNSPYSISLENRLNEAKRLLKTGELNINEIALEVGYKYAQSFSNAFTKKFGMRPKELLKNRKYYY